jgi:hypothetical protein
MELGFLDRNPGIKKKLGTFTIHEEDGVNDTSGEFSLERLSRSGGFCSPL